MVGSYQFFDILLKNGAEKGVFELLVLDEETSTETEDLRNDSHRVEPFRGTDQRKREVIVVTNVGNEPEIEE
jgi:hypothetical protein